MAALLSANVFAQRIVLLNGTDTVAAYTKDQVTKIVLEEEEHEYVDLGLPSGTLWATCNVGAKSPEEAGKTYAWGEVRPKDSYTLSNYKWYDNAQKIYTKYCNNQSYSYYDGKSELEDEDDAATQNWGQNWETPTHEQFEELTSYLNCWVQIKNKNGVLYVEIESKVNGNTMILPTSCWTKTLAINAPRNAVMYYFTSNTAGFNNSNRYLGCSIRPVKKQ